MLYSLYYTVLIISIFNYGVDGAKVLALDDENVDANYEMVGSASTQQSFGKLTLRLNSYTHKQTRECAKVLTIQVNDAEYYMDAVTVTCDVKPPFAESHGVVNVANVVYVSAQPGSPVWAVYRLEDRCVQRIYTDDAWTPLDELDDVSLTTKQCEEAVRTHKPSSEEEPLPDFQKTQGKILMVGDVLIDDYRVGDKEDKELDGPTMKMIVTRTAHAKYGRCMDIVYLDMKEAEDMLDCVQLTCDDRASFVKTRGMLVYGGLVYVRDHPQDAVWAVFRQNNRCQLRIYTDQQKELVEPKARFLSLPQCRTVLEKQSISHLPHIFSDLKKSQTNKKRPLTEELADTQKLIAQQPPSPLTPPVTPVQGPLPPQPIGSVGVPRPPLQPQPLEPSPLAVPPPVTTGPQIQTQPPQVLPKPTTTSQSPSVAQPVPPPQLTVPTPVYPLTTAPQGSTKPVQTHKPKPPTTTQNPVAQPVSSPPLPQQPLPGSPVAPPGRPSVYIINNPPPPPPQTGILSGLANKIGGLFGKPVPLYPTPAPASPQMQPQTSLPTGPVTVLPPVTVSTPPVGPVTAPVTPPVTAPAPAPAPPAPAKKPWWAFW